MTLSEAREAGIVAVRKPYWNESARLEMPQRVGTGFAPWCKLIDLGTEQQIPFWHAEDGADDWEAAP